MCNKGDRPSCISATTVPTTRRCIHSNSEGSCVTGQIERLILASSNCVLMAICRPTSRVKPCLEANRPVFLFFFFFLVVLLVDVFEENVSSSVVRSI